MINRNKKISSSGVKRELSMSRQTHSGFFILFFMFFSFCFSVWSGDRDLTNTRSLPFRVISEDHKSVKPIIIYGRFNDSETITSNIKEIKKILGKKKTLIYDAAIYAQEAVTKMTGIIPAIKLSNNDTEGIILIEKKNLPERLKANTEIMKALTQDSDDLSLSNETFFLLSELKFLVVL